MSVFASLKSELANIRYYALCYFVVVFKLVGQAANRAVFIPVLSQGRLPTDICYSIHPSDTMRFRFDLEIVLCRHKRISGRLCSRLFILTHCLFLTLLQL